MNESITLLLALIAKGVGVAKEIAELARRAQAGETITNEEIEAAEAKIHGACETWDAAANKDQPD